MTEQLSPDICIIGAGPGGIAAATAAAAEGVSVVLVEKARLGGNNLTSGAVPSKALTAAADVYEALRLAPSFGITAAPLQVNLGKVRDHIVAVTEAIARNVSAERLRTLGVTVVAGEARFVGPESVTVGETVIAARRFVLAVGAVPRTPEIPGIADVETMNFAEALEFSRKPSYLLVLGADRYALEFAQACNRLGIGVSVLDEAAALPGDDAELAAIVVDRLRAEGIRIRTGVNIKGVVRRRGGIRIMITDPHDEESAGAEIAVDGSHLLLASASRLPAIDNLGLGVAGIASDEAGIVVDGNLRTTNRRVYAIGDAVGGPSLAARAEREGRSVVRSILYRLPRRNDETAIATVAFTDPALAAVGLSETEARRRHADIRVLRQPFAEVDRGHIDRQPAGLVKVVATRAGRILGASIVGRGAAELIAPWSLAVATRLSLSAMRGWVPAYPTRSMASQRVATSGGNGVLPAAVQGLTLPTRKRIIELLRKLG